MEKSISKLQELEALIKKLKETITWGDAETAEALFADCQGLLNDAAKTYVEAGG